MKSGKQPDNAAHRGVRNYRFTEAAEEELTGIAQYGDEHFGAAQSDRYREQLKRRFSMLAEQPLFYPVADHIRPGYRRSVCGVRYFLPDRKAGRGN